MLGPVRQFSFQNVKLSRIVTYSVSVCSPEREDVVYVTFPNERFEKALAKDFRLYLVHEYIRKGDCHFRAHGRTPGGGLPYETDGDARRKF